jgi:hypothetical protein
MRISKKSQVFTLIAIAMMTFIFISYSVYSNYNDRASVSDRVKTMSSFLSSMERDLQRQMYASGFRAIFLAENYIINNSGRTIVDSGYSNISDFFEEKFFDNNPLCDPPLIVTNCINITDAMYGARYIDINKSINEKAKLMNINVLLSNPSIYIYQEDPWNVLVQFEFNLNLDDSSGLASWNTREKIRENISIEVFDDPLYVIETSLYGKKIKKNNINLSSADLSKLRDFITAGNYIAHNDAPSFLNRLEGLPDASPFGIESLVDQRNLTVNLRGRARAAMDYNYFASTAYQPSSCVVTSLFSWFRLDDSHLSVYNVSASDCILVIPSP